MAGNLGAGSDSSRSTDLVLGWTRGAEVGSFLAAGVAGAVADDGDALALWVSRDGQFVAREALGAVVYSVPIALRAARVATGVYTGSNALRVRRGQGEARLAALALRSQHSHTSQTARETLDLLALAGTCRRTETVAFLARRALCILSSDTRLAARVAWNLVAHACSRRRLQLVPRLASRASLGHASHTSLTVRVAVCGRRPEQNHVLVGQSHCVVQPALDTGHSHQGPVERVDQIQSRLGAGVFAEVHGDLLVGRQSSQDHVPVGSSDACDDGTGDACLGHGDGPLGLSCGKVGSETACGLAPDDELEDIHGDDRDNYLSVEHSDVLRL